MRKRFSWKRLSAGMALALVLCLLLAEFGGVTLFFGGIFGLSALWAFGRAWWSVRRERLARKRSEDAFEERRQREIALRRESCREARYAPEERKRVEDRLRQDLGPIADWDLEEEGDGILDLAIVLIPPTEALPFWKAATVGAGACTLEAGGPRVNPLRAELMMALPPDWNAGERWPCRVLRDAARRFLIVEGFLGYGPPYRGMSLLSAGFAGAVVDGEFPGLPELACAAMPKGPAVSFYWLIPLLKPELDYFLRRGYQGLERRFPASRPWADPGREPWADSAAWFQEDIAPFVWSENEGRFFLGLETGTFHRDLFLLAGLGGTGWDWERLVREYLRKYQPDDGPFVEYACEERFFFAASEDREIMERLALGLSDLLRDDWAGARWLLALDGRR
ncbi:MAG: suppressor of fused domain protein [Dysosmobacter sp.]|nr:suppressor of fused domain protein [Dysosmobacter sp.]